VRQQLPAKRSGFDKMALVQTGHASAPAARQPPRR
jgi:hypothetical protein